MSVELSKSEKIHQLVQKVKAGELSKSDLFEHLSSIQKGQRQLKAGIKSSVNFNAPPGSENNNIEDFNGEKLEKDDNNLVLDYNFQDTEEESKLESDSMERQRALVDQLFEQKRRMRAKSTTESISEAAKSVFSAGAGPASDVTIEGRQVLNEIELKKSWNLTYQQKTSREARRIQQDKMFNQEYTFRPKIHPLPKEHGSTRVQDSNTSQLPFNRRMEKWIEQRQKQTLKKREVLKQSELAGCTFSPRINKVKRANCGMKASERLYAKSKTNKLVQLRAEARAKEDQMIKETCTFRPKINRTSPVTTQSRYRQAVSGTSSPCVNDNECTFKPQVNEIPEEMSAAKVYVASDIFDRLYRTASTNSDERAVKRGQDDSLIDVDTFLLKSTSTLRRPKSAGGAATMDRKASSATTDRRQRQKDFEKFLARQNQKEMRKQLKLEQVAQQCTSSHTPKLCKKSLKMASKTKPGDFLERVANDALKKENDFLRKKARAADPECTFQPRITDHAKKKPARSLVELSRGDSLRRETNSRLLKLRAEERELSELTFQPKLKGEREAESRLKVASDPENYLNRIRKAQESSATKQRKAMQQLELEEMSECTFHPKIHKVPTYVKRIVRSLSLGPSRKKEDALSSSRPQWR